MNECCCPRVKAVLCAKLRDVGPPCGCWCHEDEDDEEVKTDIKPTRIVNLHYERGTVYCGRAGKGRNGPLGNPFERSDRFDGLNAIELFRFYCFGRVSLDASYRSRVEKLEGEVLECFCVDREGKGPCHCRVYIEVLQALKKGSFR